MIRHLTCIALLFAIFVAVYSAPSRNPGGPGSGGPGSGGGPGGSRSSPSPGGARSTGGPGGSRSSPGPGSASSTGGPGGSRSSARPGGASSTAGPGSYRPTTGSRRSRSSPRPGGASSTAGPGSYRPTTGSGVSRPTTGPGGSGSGLGPDGDGIETQLLSRICADQTLAHTFLDQMRQFFRTLQSNGSFDQVLADRAHGVAYIQSSIKGELLSSNCPAYLMGLKDAIDADRVVVEGRLKYYRITANGIMQIIRNLFELPRFENH